MQLSEFIDAYSDDLIYLREGRQALLTHPLRREIKDLCDASYCRMFSTVMIGSIETMLHEWMEQDKIGILASYFAEGVSNGERVKSLHDAFYRAGIRVDKEVFDDFLAIKYLRNVVVHARWKPHEKEWLEQRGFPADTRNLTENHWKKMQSVNDNMMFYIALTSIAKPSKRLPDKVAKLPETIASENVGIVCEKELPHIFWLNLERISERIYKDIQKTVLMENYYWAKDLNKEAIEGMSDIERKVLFYTSARKAGEEHLDILAQHKELTKEALYSWREYWRLTFNQKQVSYDAIVKSTQVISDLHNRGIYFKGPSLPWNKDMLPETASKLIRYVLEGYDPLREDQIALALNVGNIVYEIMPNIVAAYLLTVLLPIVDPVNTHKYLEEGEKALAAMELHVAWYWYVEYKKPPVVENLVLYRQLQNLFRERP